MRPPRTLTRLAAGAVVLAGCSDEAAPTRPTDPADSPAAAATTLGNSWTTRSDLPAGRFGHAVGFWTNPGGDPLVYVFGGVNAVPDQETVGESDVQVYNYRTDAWSRGSTAPGSLAFTNGVGRIGHQFYLAGSLPPSADGPDIAGGLLLRYDASRDRWTRLADMPHPGGRGVSGVIDGRLYVLTGFDNQYSSDGTICEAPDCRPVLVKRFFRYDPDTDTWHDRPWPPSFHAGGAGGVIGGKLYVAGGRDKAGASARLDIYDPATNKWSSGAAMPAARTGIAAAVVGQKLYVFSGTPDGGETFVYTPATNRWATRAGMPTPRAELGAVRIGVDGVTRIVTVGGRQLNTLIPDGSTNEVYTPF
jgi:N-acetylneuraminic acid mutarotase